MRLEEIESFHCLENSVNESYSEIGSPVVTGLISDEDGPTSIGMALVGAALVIYVFYKHYKKRKQ